MKARILLDVCLAMGLLSTLFRQDSLALTATKGYAKIVECLLLHGADVNAKTMTAWIVIMLAVSNKRATVAQLLTEFEANIHGRSESGFTALIA